MNKSNQIRLSLYGIYLFDCSWSVTRCSEKLGVPLKN